MELILKIIDKLFLLFELLIFARVFLSWLPLNRESSLVQFVYTVTEPVLKPIRFLISKSIFGGRGQILDFSPFIAYMILDILKRQIAVL